MRVVLVNLGDNSVTFRGPHGHTRWVKVKDHALQPYLRDLKPGDIVSITYLEAVALTVTPS
jgi:hypothetical protein